MRDSTPLARLEAQNGSTGQGRSDMTGAGAKLERGSDNQVTLGDAPVSPSHPINCLARGSLRIEELGNSPETFVNGRRIPVAPV